MTKEQAEFVAQLLEDDDCEAEVREEYSGRGMYSRTTAGVVTDADIADILRILWERVRDGYIEDSDFPEAPNNLRTDSMGRRTIIY